MGQIGKAVTHMVQAEGESKNECLWMIYHCVQRQATMAFSPRMFTARDCSLQGPPTEPGSAALCALSNKHTWNFEIPA